MEQAQRRLTAYEQVRINSRRIVKAVWLWALLVGCVAIIPRCLGLVDFFTVDEAYHWIGRVRLFSGALEAHQWAKTNLTGHPGVTTMWLGSLGRLLAHRLGVPDEHSALGPTAAYLAMLRFPLAAVNGLAVVAGYLLLRRLLRPGIALLAGLMWAAAPFLIAFDRLLHVDGLLTTFIALSLLLLIVAADAERRATAERRYLLGGWALAGSGVCAGLAVASKSPGLFLLPWAGLVLLAAALGSARRRADGWWPALRAEWRAIVGRTCASYLIWLACAALTLFVVWPAMWVGPRAAFGSIIAEMIDNGGQPHASGSYFLGAAVSDPGWGFYPVVVALRSTPLMLIGLLALPLALRHAALEPAERRTLAALAGFALLFGLGVGFAAKKFDRYLLPAWPALEILAAADLYRLAYTLIALVSRGAWHEETPVPEAYIRQTPPLYTLRSYGITYATIHQLPRPYDTAVNALFGDGLALRGYAEQRAGSTLTITPSWDVRRDQPGGTFLFLHVLAPDGRRVAQIDAPLDDALFAQWQAGQQFGTPLPLALPPDLPAGEYRVVMGVYRPVDSARLALSGVAALAGDVDGPNALLLTTIAVPLRP